MRLILCLKAEKRPFPIPKSETVPCAFCGEEVVISPAGLKLLSEAQPICMECFKKERARFKVIEWRSFTEEQWQEVEKIFGFRPSEKEVWNSICRAFSLSSPPRQNFMLKLGSRLCMLFYPLWALWRYKICYYIPIVRKKYLAEDEIRFRQGLWK